MAKRRTKRTPARVSRGHSTPRRSRPPPLALSRDMELPGPEYVRVLAVLPRNGRDWLVAAAEALRNGQPPVRIDTGDAGLPPEFKLDQTFYSVALGSTHPVNFEFTSEPVIRLEDLDPKNSKFFVIRGFVKANTLAAVPQSIGDLTLFSDPSTCALLTCGTDPAVGSVRDVRNKLGIGKLEAFGGLDGSGVAVAVVDSGVFLQHLTRQNFLTGAPEEIRPHLRYPLVPRQIGDPPVLDVPNSWTPLTVATPPGRHRIDHGTMCAYNVLAVAPKATLLDYPTLIARAPGDHSVNGTVGPAIQAYGQLIFFWINNLVAGGPYKALVINNSWGIFHPCEEDFSPGQPGRFIDNPKHPFHVLVRILTILGVDIIFAAGNGGLPCPAPPFLHLTVGSIRGANAYQEVLTVAGCDLNDSRVGYSSQGPAVAMFPLPTPSKPDLTAYTHFLGSQVFGEREPDRGTSTACPIVAGCVAALRSHANISPALVSPAALFDALRNTARQVATPGWNQDYGHGIIDPVAAARDLGLPIP